MRPSPVGRLLVFGAAVLLLAPRALAADAIKPATLRVQVLDPSGAGVPGAIVTVAAGDDAREAITNGAGLVWLEGLPAGRATIQAAMSGFETLQKLATLRGGRNEIELALPLARRAEDVSVRPDDRATAGQGFGTVLTPAEIAALPDDPDELEAALRGIAGPDAVLQVNGFSGGRLPPKSQIRQIRFQMNPYSAEYHEAGHPRIDILTKPGLGAWKTALKSSFRSASLNARPPLAPEQPADDYSRYGLNLDGPLWKGKTSFALTVDGRSNDGARTIRATVPSGPVSGLAPQTTDKLDLIGRLEHAWGASHTLRAEYQGLRNDQGGLFASGLDLEERGYDQRDAEQLLRVSDSGALGKRVATETLLELRKARTTFEPLLRAPAVQALGAFSAGGAQVDGWRGSRSLSLSENLDFGTKRHSLRAGFRVETERYEDAQRRNAAGTWVFPSLDAYERGAASLFTLQVGDPRVAFQHTETGVYLQDEFRPDRKTTISLGLRNESQSAVDGAFHLGPRVGLARSLNSHTTLRIGAGIFRDWFAAATRAETLRLDGSHALDLAVADPDYPTIPSLALGSLPTINRYLPVIGIGLPRIERVSAGLERTLGDARFRADYSFERSPNALRTVNLNAPAPGLGRPRPLAGNELRLDSAGRARRHSANLSGSYLKPGARWSGFLGYVFTDSRDDGEPTSVPATAAGLRGEWGSAPNDVRHRFFGFGRARLLKGVTLAAMLRYESGAPYNVTTGFDDNADGIVNDRPAGMPRNAARGDRRLSSDVRLSWSRGFGPTRAPRGPTAQIVRLGDGEMPGELPGPDANRRFQVSVYAQAFNAANHTNVRAYSGVLTSPFFGQPLLAEPGRRIELGASVGF